MFDIAIPEIVLCIPGAWHSQSELGERIIRDSGGYIFAGRVLMHMETGYRFELQHEAADSRMGDAFLSAGPHWAGTADMAAIASHHSVAYLIAHGGSPANVDSLMLATNGLLRAGGLGVKIETTGVSHSPIAWQTVVENRHLFSAHQAFVIYITGDETYSCGMHNFGMCDVIVDSDDAADCVDLLRIFTWYLFTEKPTIQPGQTFAAAAGAPRYRIEAADGVAYETGSLFANPYGTWRLIPT